LAKLPEGADKLGEIQKKRLTVTAAIVMSSIVLSRLTGFFREILIPNMLGTNTVGDAYAIAFRITGLMYDMLVGGAIAAALIPILSGYLARKEEEDGWKVVGTFINVVLVAMVFVSILGMVFAPQIVDIAAWGMKKNAEARSLAVSLTRILFPSVAFLMLAGITNGVLNSYQKFAAAAYGPSIYNIGSVLSILLLSHFGVKIVAVGLMCSSCIYFLVQLGFAWKNFRFYRFKFYLRHSGFRKLFSLAVPSLVSSSIVQINVIVTTSFVTFFGQGSAAALQIADRIWQMPYGVFAQGMGIAMLPTLSADLAVGDVKAFKNTLLKGLKTVLMLTIPSAVGFIILKDSVIAVVQLTKEFSDSAAASAGNMLRFFAIALVSQSIVTIINRAYYANNDTKTPLYIGAGTLLLNAVLSYVLRNTQLGVSGMVLAYSAASTLNAVLLLIILEKKMKGIVLKKLAVFLIKVIPAAIIMGIPLYFINIAVPVHSVSKPVQYLLLAIEVFTGATVYFLTAVVMRIEEAEYVLKTLKGKISKLGKVFK
jgi:putative peptidoglycan lipid II flippase